LDTGNVSFSVRGEDGQLREAYADELTDAQLKFIFMAVQERERKKQRAAERQRNTNNF